MARSLPVCASASLALCLVASAGAQPGSPNATIIRDTMGVSHIYASGLRALYYADGYAQGQDRLWQADLVRRSATGRQAEWEGAAALESDIQARVLFGSAAQRAAMLAAAPERTRAVIRAFVDGLNAWIAEAAGTGRLPVEYAATGRAAEAWTPEDVVAVTMAIGFNFGADGFQELDNAAAYLDLLSRLGPQGAAAVFADTHWVDDPGAPTTVPAGRATGGGGPGRGRLVVPRVNAGMPAAAAGVSARMGALRATMARLGMAGPHSNFVLVSPALSADGRALLLGGPQTGYTLPQFFHEVGLHGERVDVTGVGLPGVPGVAIGVGRNHAWTITTGYSDTCDIVAEALNPANPLQYFFGGEWRDMEVRLETFAIAGGGAHTQPVLRTVHGPVLGVSGGFAFTMRMAFAGHELDQTGGLLAMAEARTVTEFESAASGLSYNFNIGYADNAGNIAYWHTGRIPVRGAENPWLPHPGDGSAEWQGFVNWADMPRSVNPAQGWLANWNNKPREGWASTAAGFGDWGPVQRVRALMDLAGAIQPRTATVSTLAEINRLAGTTSGSPSGSAYPLPVATLKAPLLAALDLSADPRLPAIAAMLAGWDNREGDADRDGRYDQPQVAIFSAWYAGLTSPVEAVLGAGSDRSIVANVAARTLQGPQAALPLYFDYIGGQTAGQWATSSLVAALDALTVQYGSGSPAAWLAPVAVIHYEAQGAGAVPNVPWMDRGTYNQIVHLGHGGNMWGLNVVAPGQSGNPLSVHFADQLALYAGWQYKPMRLTRGALDGATESVQRLRVPD